MRLSALALLLVVATPLSGCKSTMTDRINDHATAGKNDEPPPPPSSDTLGQRTKTAFVGVTQALSLSDEALAQASCRCMAAAVGSPRDKMFQWRGNAPAVGDDSIVLAIGSSDKTPCDGATGARRPSIQGVESDGNNVIVTVEEPRQGIPEARGAVIQKPSFDGGYVIFRTGHRLPYGQPLAASQSAVCRIPLGPTPGTAGATKASDAAAGPAVRSQRQGIKVPVNTF